jgi:hypothetical protein
VDGNVIIGNNRTGSFLDSTGKQWTLGTGGVRFCGDSMTIVNNYFEGLTGKEWDATIAATNGDADYGEGKSLTKHYRIRFASIENNVLVNNVSNIEIGFDGAGFQGNWWNKPPEQMTVRNNIIAGDKDTLIKFISMPMNSLFDKNIVYPTKSASASTIILPGITIENPHLERRNGFLLPKGRKTSVDSLRRLTATDVGPDSK